MRIYYGIVISLLFFYTETQGQTWLELDEPKPEVMVEVFQHNLPDENANKIHGRTYFNPYPGIEEHQFFKTRQLSMGMVSTQKDTIESIQIFYDLYRDRLIVFSSHVNAMIEIEEEFITHFQLRVKDNNTTYRFINTKFIEDFPESLWPGFHQVVYDSPGFCFYKKHLKTYSRKPKGGTYVAVFDKKEQLIYKQKDRYIHVRNKKDLMMQYPGSENEIKKYLRESRINFKKAGDVELRALGVYLNQLGS
jgi:hypothetical protein